MGIELQPPSADRGVVERVAALVNHVYAEAEKGLWRGSADRTSAGEVAGFVAAGQIGVAFVDGALAGAVCKFFSYRKDFR
ncbi:hypothetical protein [Amycolatopsis sp. CA-128772]|uniref:hypothetical protein n=1 Tax=Amycolatopsis sp. CA-128772 TaxID=2073159 RepID=UPI0018EB42F1|nr:hypothetical protein [Amycolatopsis sp. CA-128772]